MYYQGYITRPIAMYGSLDTDLRRMSGGFAYGPRQHLGNIVFGELFPPIAIKFDDYCWCCDACWTGIVVRV